MNINNKMKPCKALQLQLWQNKLHKLKHGLFIYLEQSQKALHCSVLHLEKKYFTFNYVTPKNNENYGTSKL